MLIPQQIRRDFEKIKKQSGNHEVYYKVLHSEFQEYGGFCELYVATHNGHIETEQVLLANDFIDGYRKYVVDILAFLHQQLTPFEKWVYFLIRKAPFTIDVIDIPRSNPAFDAVMICGKTYHLLFWKEEITIRVEFQNGEIKTMKRTQNPTQANESI